MNRFKPAPMLALTPVLLVIAVLTQLACAAHAATEGVVDLAGCQRLAESAPALAIVQAKAWIERGGGEDARLCQAAAQFHAGDFVKAGESFEALASGTVGRNARQVANLYNRAAWAWLRAGNAARAERLYSTAIEKQPDDGELRIDRGIARIEAKHFSGAAEDFSSVLRRQPQRAEAYFYRATAYKELGKNREALADIEQALKLKPGDPDAQLLRGKVRSQLSDVPSDRLGNPEHGGKP
ncbi:MAG: tetratricopeptide repeat protein [Rhodospirillaceae bacterium]